ncbi:SDR family NAD(P)-dependent oxidoreductase [Nonomuraea fuscirosea]|uniref:SDR family NAD(P)-dependent oxidoreductase n=1 Tax=Nonomuraea fuscirosea TaxID=1291556 RepID=UPI003444BCCC
MKRMSTPFNVRTTAAEILTGVDLTGRRIIVTGGASGIGAETVLALRGAGAEVTVATRNPVGDQQALDLSDPGSVRAFVAGWTGPVHAIVANAGIMALPTRRLAANGWELQLATNFLGHFALITGLHENLRQAGDARVVMVSSGAQLGAPFDFDDPHFERRPYDPWVAYAQSKAADVLLAVGIARRWATDGVTANAFEPGYIHTRLQRHLDEATMRAAGAMDDEGNLVTPDYYKTPEQGAATSVLLAASPLLDGVTGRYFSSDNQEAEVVPGGPGVTDGVAAWSVDPVAADRLWNYAHEALAAG